MEPAALDPTPVVALADITRTFRTGLRRRIRAVSGLSFEVHRGEVFGLLGPNGSGKTTTLQMVLGLLSPSSGRVSLFGGSPRDPAARRRMGYLPEEFGGYDFLSGEEALRFYGSFFGLGRREVRRRAAELLELLGLWEDRGRRLREYSKGMRRRVGLAQCLLHDPELIVLDEPTNGLDPLGIRQVKGMLKDLAARGRTVLVSSHVLPEMEDICHRVAIVERGKLLASGCLADLLARPDRQRLVVRGASPGEEEMRKLLAGRGLTLEAMTPDRSTLEEVFLRLVEPGRGPDPRG